MRWSSRSRRTSDRGRTRPAARASRAARTSCALLAALAAALVPGARAQEQVYLDKAEALAAVFPGAERVVELRHLLTPDEIAGVEALTGRPLEEGGFYLYAAWGGDDAIGDGTGGAAAREPTGYAAVVSEVGKVRPITHIVEVRPDGAVGRVAVMIYRESHGADVAGERFLEQYRGKTLADPIRVDRDIVHIAGSTLSAHAICRGVRKALAAVKVSLLDLAPEARAARLAGATPMAASAAADAAARAEQGHATAERRVMGTLCRVEAWAGLDDATLAAALDAALDEVARWDGVLSDWSRDTPLSHLNAAPVGQARPLDPDLAAWLAHARRWRDATDGAFDPGVGGLVDLWGLRGQSPARPDAAALAAALEDAGLDRLALDAAAGTAARTRAGLRLDPGASGKGWALDRAADVLRARGVDRALLDFGSTLLALGTPPGRPGFPVSIAHDAAPAPVADLLLSDGALSISGGGTPALDDGGVARGHVIDPASGAPVPAARLAWVRCASAADADALSTALLVRGPTLAPAEGAAGVFLGAPDAAPVAWPADD